MTRQSADIYITTRPAASKLPDPPAATVAVSSWTRLHDNITPPRIKAFVNYLNSRLAQSEASRGGYDSALFLNTQGKVTEGGGSCFFMIQNGTAVTPPVTAGILESLTRDAVMTLLREELNIPVVEREMDRTELYFADEMFFTGTMLEIGPVRAVDGYEVPAQGAGPITRELLSLFERVVRGEEPKYRHWPTPISEE
jgi:branched-chain amino acid aminotransferase